ncbi:triose-phosphate transporter family-domain-containing protein [Cubamyces lactineus]|nr:triose-phosphate transporter family-domain-containing protein [Cubamyces lactineus]
MVDSSWANQHRRDANGWAVFGSENSRRAGGTNWLASLFGSKDELPSHIDHKPSADDVSQRLKSIKRSFLHRLPSAESLWPQQRAPRLTGQGQSTASPSAATIRFVLLCALWYTTSALSSNTGKSIMTSFRYPVTLTFVQFGFVAAYCLLFMSPLVRFSKLRSPNKAIIQSTLPMGVFQVGGHIFSSMAISRIPVSTVHTIKALSPLFTVAAYALLFGVSYSPKTYISLLPLTLGVMLACSFDMSASNAMGLLCAFGSAIVFVSQNIFFKKIVPSGHSSQSSHKLDKLNLLFYSSGMAFLLMIPIWVYYDLPALLAASADPSHIAHPSHGHDVSGHHSVLYYFVANGTVHFAQNIIAFVILASTSPVTYSIASLIKRVAVICIAIVWFAQPVHPVQAVGITMTFVGLYMYNAAKGDVEKGEHKMRRVEAARDLALPMSKAELSSDSEMMPERERVSAITPEPVSGMAEVAMSSAYGRHPHPQPRAYPHSHAKPPSLLPIHPPHRTHPNLHINITPPTATKPSMATSPVDSYPSPPPSLDSPPLPSGGIPPSRGMQRRMSMVTGHAAPHQRPAMDVGARRTSVMA